MKFPESVERVVPGIEAIIEGKTTTPPPPCNCGCCPSDPTLTCSYTGQDMYVEDAYLANAYAGNLFLCPGDSSGPIGGLLHALKPPQHYSHMGIMVADLNLIRHCTCSQDRLTAKEYYTGNLLGVSAPSDGLTVDHLENGWPGTITQSIYQAYYADQYGGAYEGSNLPDPESTASPETSYLMNELSFDPVSDDGQTWYPPLVVKPCPSLQRPIHTQALARIVQQALATYCYYSFYAYTEGGIGGYMFDISRIFATPNSQPEFNPATGRWKDWSEELDLVSKPLIPAVCSSFVWQMVQQANGDGGPRIVLDWAQNHADALGENGGNCVRAVPPAWQADAVLSSDGLYLYSETERITVANSLHQSVSDSVYGSLKSSLAGTGAVGKAVSDVLDDLGRAGFLAAAVEGSEALGALLTPLLPGFAVVDLAFLDQLIELLFDMPDDIANQICNAFAFNCLTGFPAAGCVDSQSNRINSATDSTNWGSAPGTGLAVSPDNIHMFWDAPDPRSSFETAAAANPSAEIRGLYGYNVTAQPCVGVFNRPICTLVPSTGTATLSGAVFYNGQALAAAYVTVACQTVITSVTPALSTQDLYALEASCGQGIATALPAPSGQPAHFSVTVRAGGQYKVVARFEDPQTGVTLFGEKTTQTIQPNSTNWLCIRVTAPPANMRQVVVQGLIQADDVTLWGTDTYKGYFQKTLYVQYGVPVFDQNTGAWTVDAGASVQRLTDSKTATSSKGDTNAALEISATINPDLSVSMQLTYGLNPSDENLSYALPAFAVSADQTFTVADYTLDTHGVFPDRGYFHGITVSNQANTAY
jgi:hypothetical protein